MIPDDAYGGTFRLFDKVAKVWGARPQPRGRLGRRRRARRDPARPDQAGLGRDPHQPDAEHRRHRGAGRASPTRPARCSSSTTPSPRRTSSSRSPSAPTSSSTRRPSTSAGTPTSSAAPSSCATSSWPSAIAFHQNAMGAVAGPFDAFLTHRGLKTLGVRMDRHCDNAEKVVEFLAGHPAVAEVIYPGLEEHPGHAVAARQMKRFGGMVSFRVAGGEAAGPRGLRERRGVHARGVARRRRVAHRAPGPDDPRQRRGHRPRGARPT